MIRKYRSPLLASLSTAVTTRKRIMKNLDLSGTTLKGRRLDIVGIKNKPEIWLVFDEPDDYDKDVQSDECRTYSYQDRLNALTTYNKLIKSYKRSRKSFYKCPIKLRK